MDGKDLLGDRVSVEHCKGGRDRRSVPVVDLLEWLFTTKIAHMDKKRTISWLSFQKKLLNLCQFTEFVLVCRSTNLKLIHLLSPFYKIVWYNNKLKSDKLEMKYIAQHTEEELRSWNTIKLDLIWNSLPNKIPQFSESQHLSVYRGLGYMQRRLDEKSRIVPLHTSCSQRYNLGCCFNYDTLKNIISLIMSE